MASAIWLMVCSVIFAFATRKQSVTSVGHGLAWRHSVNTVTRSVFTVYQYFDKLYERRETTSH